MITREGTFNGASGTELFFRVIAPQSPPKAAIIAVHGHGDHSGGLSNIYSQLTERNYIAYAFDLRGHGKSPGKRGFIRTWDEYRGDLHSFRTLVGSEHPQLPLFIVAHSLGGVISLDYCLHHVTGITGLVTIAPAISYELTLSEKVLVTLMGALKPDFTVEKPANLHQLTRDPEILARLESDALRHNTVTPGLGRGHMKTLPLLLNRAHSIKLPLLLQYGLGDEITPPAKLRLFFDTVGSADKQKLEYGGIRHRPFDELGREQFFNDMLSWLDRHTGTGTK